MVFLVTKFGRLAGLRPPAGVLSVSSLRRCVWVIGRREGGVEKEAGKIKITFPFAALRNEMAIPGVRGSWRGRGGQWIVEASHFSLQQASLPLPPQVEGSR